MSVQMIDHFNTIHTMIEKLMKSASPRDLLRLVELNEEIRKVHQELTEREEVTEKYE